MRIENITIMNCRVFRDAELRKLPAELVAEGDKLESPWRKGLLSGACPQPGKHLTRERNRSP